jgi:hypothetical protein
VGFGASPERETRPRSDSDLARELQAEWNLQDENEVPGSVIVNNDRNPINLIDSSNVQLTPLLDTNIITSNNNSISNSSNASLNKEIMLYHFNGLEGTNKPARLAPIKLTYKIAASSVGMQRGFGTEEEVNGSGILPIEEVLRTRWPSAKIDWMGKC